MGGQRALIAVIVSAAVVLALAAGGLSLVVTGVLPWPGGTADQDERGKQAGTEGSDGAEGTDGAATPTPKPTPTRDPAAPVLADPTSAKQPTSAGLAKALASVLDDPALGKRVGVAVRDVSTGESLYGQRGGSGFVPASTTKLVSGAAVLAALGSDHRFQTTVVRGERPSEVVLVGGGDPLLATERAWSRTADAVHDRLYPEPATIDELAARTAEQLADEGVDRVTVRFDDSRFSESESSTWESQYVGSVVSPISALWVDEGRVEWPYNTPRAGDPSTTAAKAFVKALGKHGIRVRGEPTRRAAPDGADELAAVSSPPVAELVEHTLLISDNDAAEVLALQVAVAQGEPGTFDGAARAIGEVLRPYGIAVDQLELYDGSGLSRDNRLTPHVLTELLAAAADDEHPELRPLLTGLPIAAFNGSLGGRFGGDGSAASGQGVVRAKTGTLTGVSSLAGVVTTEDGSLLAFAVVGDKLKGWAEPALDQVAAKLAECGCR